MNAVTTVLVGTQVSGTVKSLHVDFNSRVKKGQIIAEIDPETFQAQVDQAKANLSAAKANVLKARAVLQDSARTKDRNKQLFSRNLIAKSDLDTSEANYDSNDAQVAATLAQVAQTEAALRFAETNLKYTRIVSPVDGIVVSRNVDVGQTVAASFQTPTLFTIAQDLTKMQIDTSVDEADIGKIRTGQDAEFSVDAYPDNIFHGNVHQIRIAPITVQNVVTYDVVVKVDNTDMKLKPGMTANVSVVVASREDVLKVSNAALRFRPPQKEGAAVQTTSGRPAGVQSGGEGIGPTGKPGGGSPGSEVGVPARGRSGGEGRRPMGSPGGGSPRVEGGGPGGAPGKTGGGTAGPRKLAVWVLDKGKPARVPVTVGITDGAFTEIISGELKDGQEVITETLSKSPKGAANGGPQSSPRFIR
jgi:HlyD family secretion protein